ncbi:MAG: 2-oxoglutarate dehydrogenase E1 component, partial [Bacteroidia bacterium]
TGKIYYELLKAREEKGVEDVAIVRIEQLYPFPATQIEKLLEAYPANVEKVWVQEEPANMGARCYIQKQALMKDSDYISRQASGTTAEGLDKIHRTNQATIIDNALTVV